jgi:hypothetical protein
MRVNRRFLYWGVVFLAIGGTLVAAETGAIDTATLTDLVRLWPLAIIAIGLSLVLRRTRFSVAGLVAAALIPGLVVGAAFAAAPRWAGNCGAHDDVVATTVERGTFDGPATVSLRSGCGVLHVTTANGDDWTFTAASTTAHKPKIVSTPLSLSVDVAGRSLNLLDGARDDWNLALPRTEIEALRLVVTTGKADIDLSGANVDSLDVTTNAGEMVIDASNASVHDIDGVVNVGQMSITLPAGGDLQGSLRVGAGRLEICRPPGLGLFISSRGAGDRITVDGDEQNGSEWMSSDYRTAPHRADLDVHVTFGAVEVDPIGGCK